MRDITKTMLVDKVSPSIINELNNKDIYVCKKFREYFIHVYANDIIEQLDRKILCQALGVNRLSDNSLVFILTYRSWAM